MVTTQRKGDIGVTQAIATFTKLNFDVSLPVTESAAYDLLVDDYTAIHRVQVKFWGGTEVDLRRIHSNSKGYVIKKTKTQAYDWLYILKSTGEEFLIKKCLDGRRSIKPSKENLISEQIKE